MKLLRSFLAASIAMTCLASGRGLASTATYSVTFTGTWSQATHPSAYPAGAHFSALVGGVHNDQVSFWSPGGLASPGIEQMAEVGGTSLLSGEVQAAINGGNASAVVLGGGIASPGSTTTNFQVSSAFPLITLTSMVAPTPDWFVGVHGLDLRDGVGWMNQVVVDLFGYDAGTEQGTGFSLANPDTVPHQPISLLTFPFTPGSPRLATFTFSLVSSVPEPSTVGLFLSGATSALFWRRKR